MNQHSESELIVLMKQGRREAFNEIYERYWLKLYTTALMRLRSREEAMEVVQEFFIGFWINRDSLAIDTTLSSYLLGAVKNRIMNLIHLKIVHVSAENEEVYIPGDQRTSHRL